MPSKISIIVPVFNAEDYLERCLNSIIFQTYVNFEVILVDDGSSDNSKLIYNSFKNIDSRFRVFFIEHGGVSRARNEGLKRAVGEYMCFVDADDQIAPTYLEDLYLAMGTQVDSSMGGFQRIDLLSHVVCEIVPKRKIETLEENLLGFYNASNTDWQRYLWNRMFKKSIIQDNHLLFKEDIYYKEDGLFVVQYLCASNGLVGCVDKVLYYYYRNTSGAMSKTWHSFDEKVITNLEAHRLMNEVIRGRHLSEPVLFLAESQAKAACKWILQMMWQTKSYHLFLLIKIEKIMISILGIRKYLLWRLYQFKKKIFK